MSGLHVPPEATLRTASPRRGERLGSARRRLRYDAPLVRARAVSGLTMPRFPILPAWAGALCACALLAAAPDARADDYKIGYIQIERILREAAFAKSAMARIEQDFKPREDALARREQELRDEKKALERDAAAMAQAQRTAREHELDVKARDLVRAREQFVEALRERQYAELEALKQRLDRTLTKLAHDQKYDLILQQALYAGRSIDITDEVLKALEGP